MLSGIPFYRASPLYSMCWFHFLGPTNLLFLHLASSVLMFRQLCDSGEACISRSENPACRVYRLEWLRSQSPSQTTASGKGGGHDEWQIPVTAHGWWDQCYKTGSMKKKILLKKTSQKDGHCCETSLSLTLCCIYTTFSGTITYI